MISQYRRGWMIAARDATKLISMCVRWAKVLPDNAGTDNVINVFLITFLIEKYSTPQEY